MMTLTQVWGALLIFTICPLLGWLPAIAGIMRFLTGKRLKQLGTGNVSVSAAFYHGGQVAGILAVLSEASKGIAAVLLARMFFPADPAWELLALIALVMGRYWFGGGAGTTNVVWGYVAHDPITAGLVFLIGGIGFTILRERQQGRVGVLILFPLITALRHSSDQTLIGAAIALAGVLYWIYQKIPDDLDLTPENAQSDSRSMFQFFRGDRAVRSLDHKLDANKVGQKAATLAALKQLGYPVPMGWVLVPGDDPDPLLQLLTPSPKAPLIVRSSVVGEDSETASAAGQYTSIPSITSREALLPAITRCFASYDNATAVQYRQDFAQGDRHPPNGAMAVLIQQQVRGVFSGVAFSRDPVERQGDAVVIEGLPGNASRVVSGQVTPESYRVHGLPSQPLETSWLLPEERTLEVEGEGDLPPRLVQQVAFLARHLETHYHGTPQDIEWSYDGQRLWLLQSRPITTLLPIWTRKIAAEVIPGLIRPLTWSINRPLTCGVWGNLFTLVLGTRARGLDFNQTATLHYSYAYFNATLLGQLFRRMGLPPESLEFLTRGAKFSQPPLVSTLRNLPGLLQLVGRELRLEQDFRQDDRRKFAPALAEFASAPASGLAAPELLARIDRILELLTSATYYSILAPLSAALRKAIFKVSDRQIDNSATPEIAAVRSLQDLAIVASALVRAVRREQERSEQERSEQERSEQERSEGFSERDAVFRVLAEHPEGQAILVQFDQILQRYGYLSEVGTDIAVPTWQENPQPVQELFSQFCLNLPESPTQTFQTKGKAHQVQRRFTLKGRVTEVYSRLLAELRWSFVALEQQWLQTGLLQEAGDIFFLEFEEIRQLVEQGAGVRNQESGVRKAQSSIDWRRQQLERDRALEPIPYLVYGNDPPAPNFTTRDWQPSKHLQGIGASPGQVEGRIKIVRSLQTAAQVDRNTILVVPYTDSGWAPLLARVGGLISEVGGRLSHGAIVAREYRIPAVMDLPNAMQLLKDGQQVRIDGQRGTIEIL